ncbi:Hypervirulence associated protein TUDOR domain-containing protein [Litorimonas haliclonae]
MTTYKEGAKVQWDWASGTATGKVETVYTEDVTRKIKGTEVKRKASKDEPAYYIKQDDGDGVLKSHSEVKKA